jgi:hypothetical protein
MDRIIAQRDGRRVVERPDGFHCESDVLRVGNWQMRAVWARGAMHRAIAYFGFTDDDFVGEREQ